MRDCVQLVVQARRHCDPGKGLRQIIFSHLEEHLLLGDAQIVFPPAVFRPLLHDECDEHADRHNQDFPHDLAPPMRGPGELRKSQWSEHGGAGE
jgi:hypothetical protein